MRGAHCTISPRYLATAGFVSRPLPGARRSRRVRHKDSHRTAVTFLDRIAALVKADRLVVHVVTEDQELAAWEWLRKHDERVYSSVDATSFRVMRGRRLREALAFDQDFAAAGFVEVRD
jgi:predicted nucleic acid-binding protein